MAELPLPPPFAKGGQRGFLVYLFKKSKVPSPSPLAGKGESGRSKKPKLSKWGRG